MSFNNEILKLKNIKLQLNSFNTHIDSFILRIQSGLIPNIGVPIEEISLKLINLGLEMLNIEMQSKDIPYFNSAQQIKNIGDMMQNIALKMTNMNSMKMPMPNIMMNNNFDNMDEYMIIKYTTDRGNLFKLSFKYGTTVKEIIEKFCNENRILKDDNHLDFIYNAQKINKNDITAIEIFFKDNPNPNILVIDCNNIIG